MTKYKTNVVNVYECNKLNIHIWIWVVSRFCRSKRHFVKKTTDISKLNKNFYVNFSLKVLLMNSSQSEYGFRHGTQLIRCIFYIPENLEECILVMHTINLGHPFYIIENILFKKTFELLKFSYFFQLILGLCLISPIHVLNCISELYWAPQEKNT